MFRLSHTNFIDTNQIFNFGVDFANSWPEQKNLKLELEGIDPDHRIINIGCGDSFVVAVCEKKNKKHALFEWGMSPSSRATPKPIKLEKRMKIKKIKCGAEYIVILGNKKRYNSR